MDAAPLLEYFLALKANPKLNPCIARQANSSPHSPYISMDPQDPFYLLDLTNLCSGQLPTPPPSPFTKAALAKVNFAAVEERCSTLSSELEPQYTNTLPGRPLWPNTLLLGGVPVQQQQQQCLQQYGPAQHVPAAHHLQAHPIPTPHIPKKRGPYKTKDKSLKAISISPKNRVVGRGGMVSLGHSKDVTNMLKAQAQAQAQAQVQGQGQPQPQPQPQAPVQPRNEEGDERVEIELDMPLLTDTTSIDEDEPVDGGAVLSPCPFTNQTATVQEQGSVSMVGRIEDGCEKGIGRVVEI